MSALSRKPCSSAEGYDGVISIEHEDSYMSVEEGLNKAVANMKQTSYF